MPFAFLEGGDAPTSRRERIGVFFPIWLEQFQCEIIWDWLHIPRFCVRLKCAQRDPVALATVVNAAVRIAAHGQGIECALNRFGNNVMVLDWKQGNADTDFQAQFSSPHAATNHDDIGTDVTLERSHTDGPTVCSDHVCNAHVLEDFCAAQRCTFRQCERGFSRQAFAIVRQPCRSEDIIDSHQGPFLERHFWPDHLSLHAKQFRHRHRAAQLNHSVLAGGNDQTADGLPTDIDPGFGLQCRVQFDAVLVDFGHAVAGAQLSNQSCRVPSRATTQFALLEQHHIRPAEFGQVVRDARADDAATDDHGAGLGW